MRNSEECRSGSKYNLMQKTSRRCLRGSVCGPGESRLVSAKRRFVAFKGKGEIWSCKGGGDPIMLKRVLLYKLCTNKKEDKNEAESSLR